MPRRFALLDSVALLHDVPDARLVQGQVGTIVEVLDRDMFLVEFSGDNGKSYAVLPLAQDDLLRLHFTAEAAE